MFDGHLFEPEPDESRLLHLWPEDMPDLLVDPSVYERAEMAALALCEPYIDEILVPVVEAALHETLRQLELDPDCNRIQMENTTIGTVVIRPNSRGGMTLYTD